MNDPYLVAGSEDFRKIYSEYFICLCRHLRNKSLNRKQESYLLHFVRHLKSSAYDIEPGRNTNQSNYRRAKLTLKKIHKYRLIELVKSEQEKKEWKASFKKIFINR
jgi:hypothetical protein